MPWPLPENPFPPDTVCIQAFVPNDPAYLDAFFGQMLDLATAYNWANDDAHTALLARDRMRIMYSQLRENNCDVCPPVLPPICGDCDCGECMKYQQVGCLLQVQDCLTGDFVTIFDASACVTNPAPGNGTKQPAPGACADASLKPDASQLTPLPWLVNTGDTLNFTTVLGAGTDNGTDWYCPDGSSFFLGACAGGGHLSGSDPLPSTKHMALLIKIGANYYPLAGGVFIVPGGITNLQPFIQVNDPTVGNCRGQYTVNVTYCNNATPPVGTWRAKINFALNSGGFITAPVTSGVPGIWVPGSGWQNQVFQAGGLYWVGCELLLHLAASTHVTSCTMKTQIVPGGSTSSGTDVVYVQDDLGACLLTNVITFGGLVSGENDVTGALACTLHGFELIAVASACGTPGGCGGTVNISELDLAGTGTIPPELAAFSY